MNFGRFVFFTTMACSAAAFAAPSSVVPLFNGKAVRTFAQHKGDTAADPIAATEFPVRVLEESLDGARYRVMAGGRDVWIPKIDVKAENAGIDAKVMCSTMVASVQAGATRNANDSCRPQK